MPASVEIGSPSFEAAPSLGGNMGARFSSIDRIEFNSLGVQNEPLSYEGVLSEAEAILSERIPVPQRFINAFSSETQNQEPKTGEINTETAVVEHPINKARKIWEELVEQPSLTEDMLRRAYLAQEAVRTKTNTIANLKTRPVEYTGNRILNKADVHQNNAPYAAQQALKKEDAINTNKSEQGPHSVVEERINIKKKKFVLDEKALGQRTIEIGSAVRKAKDWAFWAGIRITGALVARFLPGQHPGNESEAIKGRGLDGSIPETIKEIENQGEFTSEYDAENKSLKVAYEKPPIKLRHEGEGHPVQEADVYRVFQIHEVKPALENIEPKIEDYPNLAEVFKT